MYATGMARLEPKPSSSAQLSYGVQNRGLDGGQSIGPVNNWQSATPSKLICACSCSGTISATNSVSLELSESYTSGTGQHR